MLIVALIVTPVSVQRWSLVSDMNGLLIFSGSPLSPRKWLLTPSQSMLTEFGKVKYCWLKNISQKSSVLSLTPFLDLHGMGSRKNVNENSQELRKIPLLVNERCTELWDSKVSFLSLEKIRKKVLEGSAFWIFLTQRKYSIMARLLCRNLVSPQS